MHQTFTTDQDIGLATLPEMNLQVVARRSKNSSIDSRRENFNSSSLNDESHVLEKNAVQIESME